MCNAFDASRIHFLQADNIGIIGIIMLSEKLCSFINFLRKFDIVGNDFDDSSKWN